MTRKKNTRKHIWITEADKRAADELKENIGLGLVEAPKDYDIYLAGVEEFTDYSRKIKEIRENLNSDDAAPSLHPDYLATIDSKTAEHRFLTSYEQRLAHLRGEDTAATDEFGFPVYSDQPKIGKDEPLDNIYKDPMHDAVPSGMLEFFSLSLQNWNELEEAVRLELRRIWDFKQQYGNV